MTHDNLTDLLRNEDWPTGSRRDYLEAADRLDLYRELLRRCAWSLPATERFRSLHRDIAEALK